MRIDDPPEAIEVGRFKSLGDALWSATVFASHKGWQGYVHYVVRGKKTYHPSSALNPNDFNFIDKEGGGNV